MGRNKRPMQGCEYSKLDPNAREFFPAVVSSCEGTYSADRHASFRRDLPKSSRPPPYSNNNEKLSFSFLETDEGETIEINEPRVDFVSELPSVVVENILQHLDVASIQNYRKVSRRWNEVIVRLKPNVIKDIEKDADFIRRLTDSRLSSKLPEEPYYQDMKCASCAVDKDYCNNMWAIKHDIIKLIIYHYECEDKSKKYDCPHCPDWFVKDGEYGTDEEEESDEYDDYDEFDEYDPDDSSLGWREREDEDFQRRPEKITSPVKRHFRSLGKHFAHLFLRHCKEINQFLLNEQKLIPLPRRCVDRHDDHQQGFIDKLTEDMVFQGDGYSLLSNKL